MTVPSFERASFNPHTMNGMDVDLCDLLQSLSLASQSTRRKVSSRSSPTPEVTRNTDPPGERKSPTTLPKGYPTNRRCTFRTRTCQTIHRYVRTTNKLLSHANERSVPQSDTTSESSQSSSQPTQSRNDSSIHKETYGCAYLKILQGQIALDGYPTTGGDYLEAIFTHREIFTSFPPSHQDCARAFSDMAFTLERRAWRADRDADTEAVAAFRHEAWMIAAWQ